MELMERYWEIKEDKLLALPGTPRKGSTKPEDGPVPVHIRRDVIRRNLKSRREEFAVIYPDQCLTV